MEVIKKMKNAEESYTEDVFADEKVNLKCNDKRSHRKIKNK